MELIDILLNCPRSEYRYDRNQMRREVVFPSKEWRSTAGVIREPRERRKATLSETVPKMKLERPSGLAQYWTFSFFSDYDFGFDQPRYRAVFGTTATTLLQRSHDRINTLSKGTFTIQHAFY